MGLQSTSRIYKKSSRHGCTESQLEKLLCEFNAMKRSYFPLDGSGSACGVIPIRNACIMACYRELHVGQWNASRIALDLEVTVNTIFTKKEANEATPCPFCVCLSIPAPIPSQLPLNTGGGIRDSGASRKTTGTGPSGRTGITRCDCRKKS